MDKCVVCEKDIPKGSTHCSVACIGMSRLEGMEKSHQAGIKFNESVKNMLKMEAEPALPPVVKKIYIKHRWKKDFNVLMRDTIFVFNGKGVAAVPLIGNVLEDVESLKRKFQGQVAVLKDDELDKDPWALDILPKVEEVEIKKEAEEPKVEKLKIEEPKVEEPKVEEPKVEEPKVEEEEVKFQDLGLFAVSKDEETSELATDDALKIEEEDHSVVPEQQVELSEIFRKVEITRDIDPVVRRPVKKTQSKKTE